MSLSSIPSPRGSSLLWILATGLLIMGLVGRRPRPWNETPASPEAAVPAGTEASPKEMPLDPPFRPEQEETLSLDGFCFPSQGDERALEKANLPF